MRIDRRTSRVLLCLLLASVAGCANQAAAPIRLHSHLTPRYYGPPPGPPSDPWGPYIREAAAKSRIPEKWIRAVMRQESGGHEDATSSAGAMGLMQVMPATYAQLAGRYGLGDDPYEPHDNMMAGAAYLREMYDRYGSPGFLAAYNAGPGRVNAYLAGAGELPDETVNYVASIAPRLGNEIAPSGPLAGFAGSTAPPVAYASDAGGCDSDAAYDPNRPCRPIAPATPVTSVAPFAQAAPVAPVATASLAPPPRPYTPPSSALGPILVNAPPCDPDAAYDPSRTCRDVPVPPAALAASAPPCDPNAAYDPRVTCRPVPQLPDPPPDAAPVLQLASAQTPAPLPVAARSLAPPLATPPAAHGGAWAIQVGAFAQPSLAHEVAAAAQSSLPDLLGGARIALPTTSPFGGTPLYRARLTTLSPTTASAACARLVQRGLPCLVVPPEQGS